MINVSNKVKKMEEKYKQTMWIFQKKMLETYTRGTY